MKLSPFGFLPEGHHCALQYKFKVEKNAPFFSVHFLLPPRNTFFSLFTKELESLGLQVNVQEDE